MLDNIAIGNHGIAFTTTSSGNEGVFSNITIRDCKIDLYGNAIYGIHLKQNGRYVTVDNNYIKLYADTAAPDDAYNTIAIYGDSEFVNVINNHVWGGHSPIAVSTAGKTNISNNFVYDCLVTSEAGIEFEYKGGHGTVGYQPENCIISNNQVDNCYIGILVTDRLNDATSKSPKNVIISGNIVTNSVLSDIEITSSFSAAGDDTTRISNVIIDSNQFLSSCSEANIRSRDGSNLKITNNITDGGANAIKLGRNSTIKVRGDIDVSGNTMRNFTTYGVRIETADNINFSMTNNKIYGGVNGFFSNADLNAGGESSFQFMGNYLDGMSDDGFAMTNSNIEGALLINNVTVNCGARGWDLTMEYFIYDNNITRNIGVVNKLTGTNRIIGNFYNL